MRAMGEGRRYGRRGGLGGEWQARWAVGWVVTVTGDGQREAGNGTHRQAGGRTGEVVATRSAVNRGALGAGCWVLGG